ncbi:MAG: VCBS repeat-containing protein [Planctomycetes bacterium]|nr:VCBS repeat-containing protein [Planctomycetota bacterium]
MTARIRRARTCPTLDRAPRSGLLAALGLQAALAAVGAAGPAWAAGAEPDAALHDGPWTLPAPRRDDVTARFNRGVSLMERQEPAAAVEELRKVTEALPRWLPGRVNLGIALLNSQRDADLPVCEKVLRDVLEDDPSNPHAHYALGMLYLHGSDIEKARVEFEATLRADPGDPFSHYQLGTIARTKSLPEDASRRFRSVLELSPHFSSAYYSLSRLAFLAGKREEGKRLLDRFLELERTRLGLKPGMKYTEMGRYADVIRNVRGPGPAAGAGSSARFSLEAGPGAALGLAPLPAASADAAGDAALAAASEVGPEAVAGDIDGDADADLLVAAAVAGGDRLYWNDGKGKLARAAEAGLAGGPTTAVALGDPDGAGDHAAYLGRPRGPGLLRNAGGGRFEEAGPDAGLTGNGGVPSSALFGDVDRDGDLDLLVAMCSGGRGRLWINLGTGSFEDQAEAAGLALEGVRSALLSDLDGDGDTDVYAAVDGGRDRLFVNDRPLRFRETSEEAGAGAPGPAAAACSADLDGDGLPELFLARGASAPPLLLRNAGRSGFLAAEAPAPPSEACLAGDLDLDGRLDLLAAGRGGVRALLGDGAGGLAARAPESGGGTGPWTSALLTDLEGDGVPEAVLCGPGEAPLVLRPRPPREHKALRVELKGVRRGEECFSNLRGVGARVEVKAGERWSVFEVGAGGERVEAVVRAGLGPRTKADYVRIQWPDGLIQSELEVPSGQVVTIEEVQRKASSCPLLFAWDGERLGFVTDFLGGGGLGFLAAPGVYAPPDPTEDVRIPPGLLAASGGKLRLRIAEPFEEVCYLDQVSLLAVDSPEGVGAYPEERFASSGPDPTGRIVAAGTRCLPVAARDLEGRDVLELVSEADRRAPPFQRDPRFAGFAREHALELDFGPLGERCGAGQVFLFLDAWVEYGYSHVTFAAAQAGESLRPPSLEVPDGRGGWRVAFEDLGYPAGMRRTMVVPLPRAAVEAGRFRIRTTMEVSWDRAFAAADLGPTCLRISEARLAAADLRYLGYPAEVLPDGREPALYDYERRAPGLAFRCLRGAYTRFGDVTPLLAQADDRFAIFGSGEEVALELDASSLPPLEAGMQRTFVLRARGYCKDRDPHTAHGETVEPLPFRAMSGYPYPPAESYPDDEEHRRYREEWNTREAGEGR